MNMTVVLQLSQKIDKTLHKKSGFPWRISSENVIFFVEEIRNGKLYFLCSEISETPS